VTGLFAANLALNLAWTWIFFRGHAPRAAGVEILVLLGTIVALIRLIWPHNRAAALALAPYGAWVAFATGLTWTIAARNCSDRREQREPEPRERHIPRRCRGRPFGVSTEATDAEPHPAARAGD
jgi:hypothetical protein